MHEMFRKSLQSDIKHPTVASFFKFEVNPTAIGRRQPSFFRRA